MEFIDHYQPCNSTTICLISSSLLDLGRKKNKQFNGNHVSKNLFIHQKKHFHNHQHIF